MSSKFYYPVIFAYDETDKIPFGVEVPDLPGCYSQGETLPEAVEMSKDAIGCYLDGMPVENYPAPSNPADIKVESNQFVMLVEFDKLAYDKKYNSKAVKKTLSVPAWLNELALAKNINFSNVLQNALMRELDLV